MGISVNAMKCLLYARKSGIEFKSVITLGRQHFFSDVKTFHSLATDMAAGHTVRNAEFPDQFAEPLFKMLGADSVDSMDVSSYEGATVLHDMNNPIPDNLKERYDLVFDGGTLEHVFNFPQAIKNAMQMVKKGGYFMGINPCNNQLGHGFYQFSPELYFRIMSEENGFTVVKIFVAKDSESGKWYEVKDPHEVHERVTLVNDDETSMIVIAQRVAVTDIFKQTPQQSDYASTWKEKEEQSTGMAPQASVAKAVYQKVIPASVRARIWKMRYNQQHKKQWSNELGKFDPKHFTRTDI